MLSMKSIALNESFCYFVYKCLTTNLSRDLFWSTYYFVNHFNNTMDANPCWKIMIKHTIQQNNLTVIYLHNNDNCIEIYRIHVRAWSLLLSYMFICNEIQKIPLIYRMHFRDIQRLYKHTPVRIIIVIKSAFRATIDSTIKKCLVIRWMFAISRELSQWLLT